MPPIRLKNFISSIIKNQKNDHHPVRIDRVDPEIKRYIHARMHARTHTHTHARTHTHTYARTHTHP